MVKVIATCHLKILSRIHSSHVTRALLQVTTFVIRSLLVTKRNFGRVNNFRKKGKRIDMHLIHLFLILEKACSSEPKKNP